MPLGQMTRDKVEFTGSLQQGRTVIIGNYKASQWQDIRKDLLGLGPVLGTSRENARRQGCALD